MYFWSAKCTIVRLFGQICTIAWLCSFVLSNVLLFCLMYCCFVEWTLFCLKYCCSVVQSNVLLCFFSVVLFDGTVGGTLQRQQAPPKIWPWNSISAAFIDQFHCLETNKAFIDQSLAWKYLIDQFQAPAQMHCSAY